MKTQNLIIYRFNALYQILNELEDEFNFKVSEIKDEVSLKNSIKNLSNYLVISKNQNLKIKFHFVINSSPINIFKLIEKIHIKFLKNNFSDNSNIDIKGYIINLNSRELLKNNKKIKLTEKEVSSIIYLFNKKKPISVRKLEEDVWKYQSGIETHTVETHIYRLRRKIFNNFKDDNFIISKKDGYQI